ncbi:MAG: 16S rRNA (cytidine(1402)-2'-O)-methyltransferase [Bacillales bacterium]|nr:16S rRNA (cytidine(1402)-2'-O)-methyltransferase [Bacillales bacterium]
MSQKSYDGSPTLYLVPTPIGNMDDITIRAINTLKNVEAIFSEDTRVTGILLKYFDIKKKLISNYEYNESKNLDLAIKYLEEGKDIALVSDAGSPIISDPGFEMAKYVISKGYNVVALPGATAFVPALSTSSINPMPFLFYGFLNSKESKRKKELLELKDIKYTIIFYEASHRILETIDNIREIMGDRYISISREISKKYEQVYRGTCSEVLDMLQELKGEFVIVVQYQKSESVDNTLSIKNHVEKYISLGYKTMDAIKAVSKDRNIPKSEVYSEYHREDL